MYILTRTLRQAQYSTITIDRFASSGARIGVAGHTGQVGDEERPPDQAEELHERREDAVFAAWVEACDLVGGIALVGPATIGDATTLAAAGGFADVSARWLGLGYARPIFSRAF